MSTKGEAGFVVCFAPLLKVGRPNP